MQHDTKQTNSAVNLTTTKQKQHMDDRIDNR